MIELCLRCSKRQRGCTGVCLCLAEKDNPVDIIARVKSGKCPMKYFDGAPMPEPPPPQPAPRNQWPAWAQALADSFEPEDRGIGDVIHRKLDAGGQLASLALKAMGVPCGCDDRRADWCVMYPNPTYNPRNQ